MLITARHLFTIPGYTTRRGFCRDGVRKWALAQGLDWKDFTRHGIDSARLEATGDALALAVVAWARQCEAVEVARGS